MDLTQNISRLDIAKAVYIRCTLYHTNTNEDFGINALYHVLFLIGTDLYRVFTNQGHNSPKFFLIVPWSQNARRRDWSKEIPENIIDLWYHIKKINRWMYHTNQDIMGFSRRFSIRGFSRRIFVYFHACPWVIPHSNRCPFLFSMSTSTWLQRKTTIQQSTLGTTWTSLILLLRNWISGMYFPFWNYNWHWRHGPPFTNMDYFSIDK